MKRSEINRAIRQATAFFKKNGWVLPPNPRWDVTDFGLGQFKKFGLVLVNLAEEKEYCEKLMYARKGQTTPTHAHKQKKEDIIARAGRFRIRLWKGEPSRSKGKPFWVNICGQPRRIRPGQAIIIKAGERITLTPNLYHDFCPVTPEAIIGEVSTANDDRHDNYFTNPDIGRFPEVEEDEKPLIKLVSDQ